MASRPDEEIVRHSYQQMLQRLARLFSYAGGGANVEASHEVTELQNLLAVDDLVHLAISCRRLVAPLELFDLSKETQVPEVKINKNNTPPLVFSDGNENISSLLNKIIHSVFLEIVQYSFQISTDFDEIVEMSLNKKFSDFKFEPVLLVRSDRGTPSAFRIMDMCVASDQLLEAAIERAAEFKIFLEKLD